MDANSIYKIKPVFLVMQTFDDQFNKSELSMILFCEKPLSVREVFAAATIVGYDIIQDPKKPFRIWKDRYLSKCDPMNSEEFRAYVSAWIETIEKYNAK